MNWARIIKALLMNKVFFLSWIDKLKLIVNDISLLELANKAQETYQKASRLPTFEELRYSISNSDLTEAVKTKTLQMLRDAETTPITEADIEGCGEILEKELTRMGLEKFTLTLAQNIHKSTFDEAYDELKKLSLQYRTASDDLGVDVRNLERTLSLIKFRDNEKIPTGIEALDASLYGGMGTSEILTIMAHSSRGKTALLVNLFYGALLNGVDAVYFSLEMSQRDILRRFYRRVTYKSKQDFHEDEKKWHTSIERFFRLTKSVGRVIYYPTGTVGTFDIEVALDRLRDLHSFEPKLVIVDHLDLVKPPKVGYGIERYAMLKLVTDGLRNIALTRNIAMVTATQATKASFDKVKLTQSDIGESYGKIQSSDVVIALCQTEEELANHRMRLTFVKNRDYVGGREVEVYMDLDKMLFTDLAFAQNAGWVSAT